MNNSRINKTDNNFTKNKDKTYNIKLDVNKVYISAEMIGNEKIGYSGALRSDWSIELPIKGEDLI